MSNDLQSDLTADLLRDLSAPAVAPTVAAADRDVVAVAAGALRTPAVSVVFTPLRWSRVSVGAVDVGTGVSLRGGPWRVDVAV